MPLVSRAVVARFLGAAQLTTVRKTNSRLVGVDGLFEQALLLSAEVLALGGELQHLEHRHLVRDLVDRRPLERDLAVAPLDLGVLRGPHAPSTSARPRAAAVRPGAVGFRLAFKDVPVVDLIALSPSSIIGDARPVPAKPGTLLSVDEARHYLFTSGYLPELGTYPGPHIPIPVELTVHGDSTFALVRKCGRPPSTRSGSGSGD